MSTTSISIICPDPKETALNIEALSRLIARLDPDDLAEEADIVGELLTAIADAAGTVASSIPYPEPKPARPATRRARPATRTAPSAFDLTGARVPPGGWNFPQ